MESLGLIEINNGLSDRTLLSYSRIKGDEEILGESLRIKNKTIGKWISRNKLHRVMAAHENYLRTIFYFAHEKISSFADKYMEECRKILEKQREEQKDRKKRIKMINSNFVDFKIYEFERTSNYKKVKFPNFAMATLSYIKNEKLITKIINVGKLKTEVRSRNHKNNRSKSLHSEAQIFDRLNYILDNETKFFEDKNFIILDIHSTYYTCGECLQDAQKLLKKFNDKKINLQIVISYVSKFGKKNKNTSANIREIKQKKIELLFLKIDEPCKTYVKKLKSKLDKIGQLDNSFDLDPELIKNVVPSGSGQDRGQYGYKSYIEEAKKQILSQKNSPYEPSESSRESEN